MRHWFIATLCTFAFATLLAVACGDGPEAPDTSPSQVSPSPTTTAGGAPIPDQSPATLSSSATPSLFHDFGSEAVWGTVSEVQHCYTPNRTECFVTVMQQMGAPREAVRFLETTGWFLARFVEMGEVDLGYIFDPLRANSIGDFALLNGTPAVIIVESAKSAVRFFRDDPAYSVLLDAFPELIVWEEDSAFEAESELPNGSGQRFVFQYTLNDGCHACLTGYSARASFDFASDGTYLFGQFLGICRSTALAVEAMIGSVPACPPLEGPAAPFKRMPAESP